MPLNWYVLFKYTIACFILKVVYTRIGYVQWHTKNSNKLWSADILFLLNAIKHRYTALIAMKLICDTQMYKIMHLNLKNDAICINVLGIR